MEALGEDLLVMKAITSDISLRSTSKERESVDDLANRIDLILQDPVIDFQSIWNPHHARGTKADSNTGVSH